MGKKKKHIQTEKERIFQEDAAKKREEREKAKSKKRIKDAFWLIGVASIILALSLAFTIWTAARMNNFENNYITMTGTISGYKIHHRPSPTQFDIYTLVISYNYDNTDYEFTDTDSYHAEPKDMIGKKTEIYVNPKNPKQVKKVTTAQTPSLVSAIAFPFGVIFYAIGIFLISQEKGLSFVKRLLVIWLPVFLWCVASVLLFWIGLPHDGFFALFSRIEGTIGYAVIAGVALLAALIDLIITKTKRFTFK